MLIIQSGLPENRMFNDLLISDQRIGWPWYDENANLRKHFKCICQVNIENEIVLIASNNQCDFVKVINDIGKDYHIEAIVC